VHYYLHKLQFVLFSIKSAIYLRKIPLNIILRKFPDSEGQTRMIKGKKCLYFNNASCSHLIIFLFVRSYNTLLLYIINLTKKRGSIKLPPS